MAENSLLFGIGAVCGVFAAFFVFLVIRLWIDTVPPLFRRWRYRGVNISGEWKGLGTAHTPANGEWSEVALTLKQNAVDVAGLMTIRSRSAAHSFDLNLQATGKISQGYVTLSLSPVSKTITWVATALLKMENGTALNGQLLYRDPFADTVDVINVSVHHAESVAMPRLHPASRPPAAIQGPQAGAPLIAAAASE
jgi:hypothetical protein